MEPSHQLTGFWLGGQWAVMGELLPQDVLVQHPAGVLQHDVALERATVVQERVGGSGGGIEPFADYHDYDTHQRRVLAVLHRAWACHQTRLVIVGGVQQQQRKADLRIRVSLFEINIEVLVASCNISFIACFAWDSAPNPKSVSNRSDWPP